MKTIFLIFIFLCFLSININAQPIYFNNNYDYNSGYEFAASVAITNDSGYFFAGSRGIGFYLYAARTDYLGDTVWSKLYLLENIESYASSVLALADGSFIMAGGYIEHDSTGSIRTNRDFYLVKINENGDTIWTKRYGLSMGPATDYELCEDVIQTKDGGFALLGFSSNFGGGNWQVYLVKTDSLGNKEWENNYGGGADDGGISIIQTDDGGYMLAGWTYSYGAGNRDFYLIKTDSAGNELWYKTYGGPYLDWGGDIYPTGDGNYVLSGYKRVISTSSDAWLIKININGNIIWEKTYGGGNTDGFHKIYQLNDGSFVTMGNTRSYSTDGYTDGLMMKVAANGDSLWARVYKRTSDPNFQEDYFWDFKPTPDGGFIIAGTTRDSVTKQDAWLVKVDCFGCDSVLCYYGDSVCVDTAPVNVISEPIIENKSTISIYPNPVSDEIFIHYKLEENTENGVLIIFNAIGEIIKEYKKIIFPWRD